MWLVWPTVAPPAGEGPDAVPVPVRLAANAGRWPGHQLLLYDDRGDGRVAEVFGDLAAATRVAVIVPGVDNRLDNFTTGHGGMIQRAPHWQAYQLWLASGGGIGPERSGPGTAVVAWLGYDPPEGIGRDALREDRAATGAVALVRFVAGLAAQLPGATFVLTGHSYGSVVIGLAAPGLGPAVTDLVAIGSPGMGVDRAADLGTSARVWAGTAATDWTWRVPGVRLLGVGHGTLPADPAFGALSLPVAGVGDHDGYFRPGSVSLRSMAAVLGLPPPSRSPSLFLGLPPPSRSPSPG
jgi:hypothetical protein